MPPKPHPKRNSTDSLRDTLALHKSGKTAKKNGIFTIAFFILFLVVFIAAKEIYSESVAREVFLQRVTINNADHISANNGTGMRYYRNLLSKQEMYIVRWADAKFSIIFIVSSAIIYWLVAAILGKIKTR